MNQPIELSVDTHGRLIVPVTLRDRLGLAPGMVLVVEQGEDAELRLRVQDEPQFVDEEGVLVVKGTTHDDLTDVVEQQREARLLELAHRGTP